MNGNASTEGIPSHRSAWMAAFGAALGALSTASCANLDSFLYNPRPIEGEYALTYPDDFPPERRVPAELIERLVLCSAGHDCESDPERVYAVMLWRPSDEAQRAPTVVYHHGNASNIDGYWRRVSILWALGANAIIYDYPGYGRTPGRPSEAGIYRAARLATDYVRRLEERIDQAKVFHYGWSLGSGPATQMAFEQPCRGLVLEAPFSSVAGLVTDASLLVPRSFVTNNEFDNRAKIRRAAANATNGVVFFHGDRDDFVQTHFSQQLDAEVASAPPVGNPPRPIEHRLFLVPGANHGDVAETGGAEGYEAPLRAFLFR